MNTRVSLSVERVVVWCVFFYIKPGVSHRTFSFRTQSAPQSTELFRSIEFDVVRPSNEIELTKKKFESNKIECSIFELNRTKEFD